MHTLDKSGLPPQQPLSLWAALRPEHVAIASNVPAETWRTMANMMKHAIAGADMLAIAGVDMLTTEGAQAWDAAWIWDGRLTQLWTK